ncbi:MAG: hypothetical protein Q8942_18105 [Bacillota bacterium]|nr:hypothetical protein [Bacillota bacterium]
MDLINDVSKFKKVFIYQILNRNRIFYSLISIVWGLLSLMSSISLTYKSFADILLIIFSIILIAGGVCKILSKKPLIILFDSIILLLLAFINVLNGIMHIIDISFGDLIYRTFYVTVLIIIGGQNLKRYVKFSSYHVEKPTDSDVESLNHIIDSITKADVKTDATIIHMRVNGFGDQIWKCKLYPDRILVIVNKGFDFHLVNTEDFEMIKHKKIPLSNQYKVSINIKGKRYSGNINNEYFSRYQDWKQHKYTY